MALGSAVAVAATIVSYTFDDGGATFINAPDAVAPNILASPWSDADGTLTNLNGLPTPGRAVAARSWHDGNNFELTLSVAPGFALDLTGYAFDEQGSNGGQGLGPTAWSMFINSNLVASGSANRGSPGGSHAGALLLSGLTGSVVIQLFATGSESSVALPDDNAANATWRIDDFVLQGSVAAVPLPPAVLLLGSAAAGLLGWRRRA